MRTTSSHAAPTATEPKFQRLTHGLWPAVDKAAALCPWPAHGKDLVPAQQVAFDQRMGMAQACTETMLAVCSSACEKSISSSHQ